MADYHALSSELGGNINDLVPANVTNLPSLTKYLGVKDWYSMNYLSICSGYFAPSVSDPSLLTSTKLNITCTRQPSGYTFSLAKLLRNELKPSVKSLADQIGVTTKSYDTAPWISFWYAGIVFTFLELLVLPFTIGGKSRIHMYTFILALVSFIISPSIYT